MTAKPIHSFKSLALRGASAWLDGLFIFFRELPRSTLTMVGDDRFRWVMAFGEPRWPRFLPEVVVRSIRPNRIVVGPVMVDCHWVASDRNGFPKSEMFLQFRSCILQTSYTNRILFSFENLPGTCRCVKPQSEKVRCVPCSNYADVPNGLFCFEKFPITCRWVEPQSEKLWCVWCSTRPVWILQPWSNSVAHFGDKQTFTPSLLQSFHLSELEFYLFIISILFTL